MFTLGRDSRQKALPCVLVWSAALGVGVCCPDHHRLCLRLVGDACGVRQSSRSVVSASLQPRGLQHTRLPCTWLMYMVAFFYCPAFCQVSRMFQVHQSLACAVLGCTGNAKLSGSITQSVCDQPL